MHQVEVSSVGQNVQCLDSSESQGEISTIKKIHNAKKKLMRKTKLQNLSQQKKAQNYHRGTYSATNETAQIF